MYKFSLNSKTLKTHISNLLMVVEKKSVIPCLKNLNFEIGSFGLRVTATNCEQFLSVLIDDISPPVEEFSIMVEAQQLHNFLKGVKKDEVQFTFDNEGPSLIASTPNCTMALNATVTDLFPQTPTEKTISSWALDSKDFATLIEKTSFASTKEESRFALNGCQLELNGLANMVATDGWRLAMSTALAVGDEKKTLLLPATALKVVAKLAETTKEIQISLLEKDLVSFSFGEYTFYTRQLSGKFPDWRIVVPKNNHNEILIDVEPFTAAVNNMCNLIEEDDYTNAKYVAMQIHPNGCYLENVKQNKSIHQSFTGFQIGNAIRLGLNLLYLKDYLKTVTGDTLKMTYGDERTQVQFFPQERTNVENSYVLMPYRLD